MLTVVNWVDMGIADEVIVVVGRPVVDELGLDILSFMFPALADQFNEPSILKKTICIVNINLEMETNATNVVVKLVSRLQIPV